MTRNKKDQLMSIIKNMHLRCALFYAQTIVPLCSGAPCMADDNDEMNKSTEFI